MLVCANQSLNLTAPVLMGVVNVTPDSFSDGGQFPTLEKAVQYASKLVAAGAAILDIGGESTRPGAEDVPLEQELERVIPVITALHRRFPEILLSIDTCKPEVMRRAVQAGAGLINDVRALQADGALETAAELGVAVCLMHMQGSPRTMQHNPGYDDVVEAVYQFLQQRIEACRRAGIDRNRILIDPGFGFGKTLDHNLALLANLDRLTALGVPILVGLSRKSMIGQILDKPVDQRLMGSAAAALIAAQKGAQIFRVHDVEETGDALKVWHAVSRQAFTA